MESDDEMIDAESMGDDCYSDDDIGMGFYDDDDIDEDYALEAEDPEDSDDIPSHRQQNYTILSEADIRQLQEEEISTVSNVLSISRVHSGILLCHYNWNVGKVHDEWFADESNVRKAVGLVEQPSIILNEKEITCGICFETYSRDKMGGAVCGHQFCHDCWRGYIGTSINDGSGCLTLRCPDPSCTAAIGQDMINSLVSDDCKEKYSRYLFRSYIESNRKMKWCPAPGCEFAVNFDNSSSNNDVSCKCSYSFCWNCREEAHRPVVCETVVKWILKNTAESENVNWILANSKACPKCKRPIEKNHGCMHMTCTPPCKFEFCWLCLGSWAQHGERTGGFYACNKYEVAKQQGVYDEAERRREMAKNSLERYTHYYERWANNQLSREKALSALHSMRTEKLEKLREKLGLPQSQLNFIIAAWEQIIECRRVLKWTYAYGYYLPENEDGKRRLFEYLQGEAESGLERLHACAEKELRECLEEKDDVTGNSKEYIDFRTKLAGLTSVTKNYFENLVRALESGLQEVSASHDGQSSAPSGPSRSKKHSCKGGKSKSKGKGVGSSSSFIVSTTITPDDYEDWRCGHCTYFNPKATDVCEMCDHHR